MVNVVIEALVDVSSAAATTNKVHALHEAHEAPRKVQGRAENCIGKVVGLASFAEVRRIRVSRAPK